MCSKQITWISVNYRSEFFGEIARLYALIAHCLNEEMVESGEYSILIEY